MSQPVAAARMLTSGNGGAVRRAQSCTSRLACICTVPNARRRSITRQFRSPPIRTAPSWYIQPASSKNGTRSANHGLREYRHDDAGSNCRHQRLRHAWRERRFLGRRRRAEIEAAAMDLYLIYRTRRRQVRCRQNRQRHLHQHRRRQHGPRPGRRDDQVLNYLLHSTYPGREGATPKGVALLCGFRGDLAPYCRLNFVVAALQHGVSITLLGQTYTRP